jgi:predicted glycosyltransferase
LTLPLRIRVFVEVVVTERILFYCQHVLGIGHLVRSAEIVRELSRDTQILFILGGEKPEGFRFPEHENIDVLQLPPLKTDPDFSNLQVCGSLRSMDETKTLRRLVLLQAFADFQPDVLVTELFPFGRKKFSFELFPLLEHVRQQSRRTMVVSSVRDILVTRKDQDEYEERVCDLVNTFYDLILVHGDKNFQKLDETFSRVNDLRCPVAYTGYVVQQKDPNALEACRLPLTEQGEPVIVASIGSGQYLTGQMLLDTVLRAAQLLQNRIPHEFHVFAGPLMPEEAYSRLQTLARESRNIRLSRYTPDLAAVLKRADVSVSMGGYNTVMDILSSHVRALVYPVTSNGDQEQCVRAEKLAKAGVLDVIRTEELTPEVLALKLERTLSKTPTRLTLNREGAANSALILKKYLAAHRERSFDAPKTWLWSQEESVRQGQVSNTGRTENSE